MPLMLQQVHPRLVIAESCAFFHKYENAINDRRPKAENPSRVIDPEGETGHNA